MQTILSFDLRWLIFWLCVIPGVAAIALYLVSQHGPLGSWLHSFSGIVAPFFASVGIIFAVFAAFLGADIWQRVQASNQALEREVSGVQSILQLADALGADGAEIAAHARGYVNATLSEELSRTGTPRSVVSDERLGELVVEIVRLPAASDRHRVARAAMLTAYESMWTARSTRRHIADTHSDPYKWLAVIFLGILTQVALMLCHVDKPRPLAAALAVFSLAFAGTLVALAMHEHPLADPSLVSLDYVYRITGIDVVR